MQADTTSNLTNLPRELIVAIFLCLEDPLDLLQLRGVSRLLKDIIDATSVLQLHIELATNALSVGTIKGRQQDIPTILRRLVSLRDAWNSLQWTFSDTFQTIRNNYTSECVTSGGVMCLMPRREVGEAIMTRIMQFPRPVPPRDAWVREWIHNDLDVDFCVVSVSQDLAVIFEKQPRLHLRTISSNTAHPLAAHPVICFEEEKDQAWKIKIFEDRIVLWFRDESRTQGRLWFCDWQTGDIVKCPGHPGLDSFAVISQSLVMTSSMADIRKPLLHLFPSDGGHPLHLELPLSTEDYRYNRIFVSDSLPSTADRHAEGTKALEPEFISTGELDVVLVHVKMREGIKEEAESPPIFNVFISRIRLIKIYEKYSHNSASRVPLRIAWNEWGPNASRWIPRLWLCPTDWALHGSRYVSFAWSWIKFVAQIKGEMHADRTDEADGDNAMILFDFNPYMISKGPKKEKIGNTHFCVVKHGEHDEEPDVFEEPLGKLAFRIAILPLSEFYQAQFDTRNGNLLIFDADQVTVHSFDAPSDT